MIHRFTGVLSNAKGMAKWRLEGTAPDDDEFNHLKPVLIETDEIESVFPRAEQQFGRDICQIRLKSGDNYDVTDSFERIEQIIKQSRVVFS